MKTPLINIIIMGAAFLVLFAVAEYLYHKLKVKAEITRKIVHFGTGILTLLFPVMLNEHWYVLILCSSFVIILLLSLKYNMLKSVNAIDRVSRGSIAYPVAVYCCYYFYEHYGYDYLYYYIPILILAISDPVAALIGKRYPYGKYKVGSGHKTIMGSSMFFLSTLILCFMLFAPKLMADESVLKRAIACSFIALTTTIAEAFTGKGYDNISIPFSALFTLIVMEKYV